MNLEEYYKKANLVLLPDSRFRQYRFRLNNKKFFSIRDKIDTVEKLRKWLLKLLPLDAYQTASCFLNPERLGPKSFKNDRMGFQMAYNCFLWKDLVVEIDGLDKKPFENLNIAYDFLKEKGYKDFLIVDTFRGHHLHCFDWKDELKEKIENPREREKFFQKKTIEILDELKKICNFDYNTSIDTRRILRVPLSVHRNRVICRIWKTPILSEPLFLTDLKADEINSLLMWGRGSWLKQPISSMVNRPVPEIYRVID